MPNKNYTTSKKISNKYKIIQESDWTTMHYFSPGLAIMHGVEVAALMGGMRFWIEHSARNGTNYHENRYWVYNSRLALARLFPYFSADQLYRILTKCIENDLLIKGNFNKISYDRTTWYALTDSALSLFKLSFAAPDDMVVNCAKTEDNSTTEPLRGIAQCITRNRTMDCAESHNGLRGIAQTIPVETQYNKKIYKKEISEIETDEKLAAASAADSALAESDNNLFLEKHLTPKKKDFTLSAECIAFINAWNVCAELPNMNIMKVRVQDSLVAKKLSKQIKSLQDHIWNIGQAKVPEEKKIYFSVEKMRQHLEVLAANNWFFLCGASPQTFEAYLRIKNFELGNEARKQFLQRNG